MITIWIAVAGGIGAVTRFAVDGLIRRRWRSSFPWATLVINVSGSLLLGALTGAVFHGAATDLLLIAGTGFCGGYTTFSTASFETLRLAQRDSMVKACANSMGTLILTFGAGVLGWVIVR